MRKSFFLILRLFFCYTLSSLAPFACKIFLHISNSIDRCGTDRNSFGWHVCNRIHWRMFPLLKWKVQNSITLGKFKKIRFPHTHTHPKKKRKHIQQEGNNTLQSHGTKINGNGCAVKTFASCTDLACNAFEHLPHTHSHGTNRYDGNIFRSWILLCVCVFSAKDKSCSLHSEGMGNWGWI